MITIETKPGEILDDGSYPPRIIFVGFWRGKARHIILNNPDDDIDDAIRAAVQQLSIGKAETVKQRRLKRLDTTHKMRYDV